MRGALFAFMVFLLAVPLSGCAVVSTAASVTGTVVSTTADVAGDVVSTAADAVTPSSKSKSESK